MANEIFDTSNAKDHFENNNTQLNIEEDTHTITGNLFYLLLSGTIGIALFSLQYIPMHYFIFISLIFLAYSLVYTHIASIKLLYIKNLNKLSEKNFSSSLTGFNNTIADMISSLYNNPSIDLEMAANKNKQTYNLSPKEAIHLVSEQLTFLAIKQIFSSFFKADDKSILGQLFDFKGDIHKTNQEAQTLFNDYYKSKNKAKIYFYISLFILGLIAIDYFIFTNYYYLLIDSFIKLTIVSYNIEISKLLFICLLIRFIFFIIVTIKKYYSNIW